MTTVKNEVFIGLLHENCYLVGGEKNLLGGRLRGQNSFRWGGMSKFWASGGDSPQLSPVVKTLVHLL